MKVGIIGGGKMGQEVRKRLDNNFELMVYDREPELSDCNVEDLKAADVLLILVPGEHVVRAITALSPYLSDHQILVNMATGITVSEIVDQVKVENPIGAAKIIGHASVMKEEGRNPVIALACEQAEVSQKVRAVVQCIGDVVSLPEAFVSEVNKLGTTQGMKNAKMLLEYMNNEGLGPDEQEKILKSYFELVALGSGRAYLRGEMGPFAKKLLDDDLT